MVSYLLFSGGLDSILAAKVLQEQDIEVIGVTLVSNFFDAEKAKISAEQIGIDLEVVDISEEMLDIVKNPPHGHGKNLNPCIDCHGFMLRKLKEKFLDQCGEECFAATGEVLGQRPFSQNKEALKQVEKIAGVEVLRPLSAQLLPPTSVEENGEVNREKLLDIQGRDRKRQEELAERYGIKDYPSPAGGCLLTDPGFSERLGEMMEKWPDYTPADVELLKHGRIFWANYINKSWVLIVVARDGEEGEILSQSAQSGDLIAELVDTTGPLTLARRFPYPSNDEELKPEFEIYIPEEWPHNLLTPPQKETQIWDSIGLLTGYYKPDVRGSKTRVKIARID